MQNLPIQAIPNQSFSVIIDNNQWNIDIRDTNGTISVSLTKNGEIIVQNARAVAGMRIIQSEYQEDGNFAIICIDQSVPDYTKFGVTQSLIYISQAELNAARTGNPDLITASFFDPLGGLPLRFSPQGYTLAEWTATFIAHASFAARGASIASAGALLPAQGSLSLSGASTLAGEGIMAIRATGAAVFVGSSVARVPATWSPHATLAPAGRAASRGHATWGAHASLHAVS